MRQLLFFLLFLTIPFYLLAQSAPGGVTANLAGWYDSNSGTTILGGAIYGWNDVSVNARHATQTATVSRPALNITTGFNYNPSISFDGQNDFLNIPDLVASNATGLSAFAVARQTANNRDIYGCILVGQTNNIGASGGYGITSQVTTNNAFGVFVRDFGVNYVSQATTLSAPTVMSGTWNGTTANAVQYFSNGTSQGTDPFTPGSIGDNGNSYIGSGVGSGSDYCFYGDIAEIAVYNTGLSAGNVSKIESYLCLKHGITKSGNYLNSSGAIIFTDAAPYNSNIIGVGRDNASNLNVKQSKNYDDSARVFVSTLATYNNSNSGVIGNDQYIVLGANAGRLSNMLTEKPPGTTGRIQREWKVTNTNFSSTFNFSMKLNAIASPGSVNTADLRLLIDDDGDFSDAKIYSSTDGLVFSYANPLITVQNISTTMIPAGTVKYMTIGSAGLTTPLPIELISFDAFRCNGEVCINWVTASEKNSDYFEIERSGNAVNWEVIGKIKGAGNSSTKIVYSEKDEDPLPGVAYYRLNQVDKDRAHSYSQIVFVDQATQSSELKIYPNPSDELVTIEGFLPASAEINLHNCYGQNMNSLLRIYPGSGKIKFSTSALAEGVYYLQIKSTPQKSADSKVIKLVIKH